MNRLGFFSEGAARRIAKHITRFGNRQPTPNRSRSLPPQAGRGLIPVELTQEGGADGSTTVAASWTYSVVNSLTGETIYDTAGAIDPTASPHKWTRPSIGKIVEATAGLGFWASDGSGGHEFVIYWTNEVINPGEC